MKKKMKELTAVANYTIKYFLIIYGKYGQPLTRGNTMCVCVSLCVAGWGGLAGWLARIKFRQSLKTL